MELEEAAHDLYGLLPGEFTQARNELAKETRKAGNRELADQIGQLRKPSTAAWLVNMLVRHHADVVEQVLSLGAELRNAQRNLDGAELRALDRQRRHLTRAVTGQARELGVQLRQKVSDQAAKEVETTLHAAMADEDAAAAVSAGLLTDSFESTGFGPVDLEGVVAVSPVDREQTRRTRPSTSRKKEQKEDEAAAQARAEAEQVLGKAEQDLADVLESAERAHDELHEAQERREEVENRLASLREQLSAAEDDLAEAKKAEDAARRQLGGFDRDELAARRAVDRARARLSS